MITAFRNFQIGIMTRCQFHTLFWHQAQEWVVFRFWHVVMNVLQNLLIAMRPGDFQHFRVDFADLIFFCPQTTGHNYLAVFIQRFTNGFQ
ncbi:Uncharacterised protein [Shigella sonnei]|nr:Uncharacterised protein [Shigella sonnei]CSI20845.1 Uncharacterised protein [Shigella sonnei]